MKKLKFGRQVEFAGFVVSDQGVKPDPAKMEAIRNFPLPKDKGDVRSFMGLSNQLGIFHPDLT